MTEREYQLAVAGVKLAIAYANSNPEVGFDPDEIGTAIDQIEEATDFIFTEEESVEIRRRVRLSSNMKRGKHD